MMKRERSIFFLLCSLLIGLETVLAGLGGTQGSNGIEPWIDVSGEGQVGSTVTFRILGNIPGATNGGLIVGVKNARIDVSSYFGSGAFLTVQPSESPAQFLVLPINPQTGVTITIPPSLEGAILYLQGYVQDAGAIGGYALTDGTSFTPATGLSYTLGDSPTPLRPFSSSISGDSVLDPRTGITYVFGGLTSQYPNLLFHPLYSYDRILEINPANPPGYQQRVTLDRLPYRLSTHSVGWDDQTKKAYIFGGGGFTGNSPADLIIAYDPSRNEGERIEILPERLPSPRGSIAVVPAAGGGLYLFGGYYGNQLYDISFFDPTAPVGQRLRLLPVQIPPTIYEAIHPIGRDDRTGKIYLGAEWMKKLVEFTPPNGPFMVYDTNLPLPPPLSTGNYLVYPASLFHQQSGKIIVVGGYFLDVPRNIYVWENRIASLDPTTLVPQQTANFAILGLLPDGRDSVTVSSDPVTGLVYTFGGWGSSSNSPSEYPFSFIHPELTVLDPLRRTAYDAYRLPEERIGTAAARDPRTGMSYIVGGYDTFRSHLSILRFSPGESQVTPLSSALLPQSTAYAAAAYDAQQQSIVLFGGFDINTNVASDKIYMLRDTPQGGELVLEPERLPTPRHMMALATDPRNGKVYLFGGGPNNERTILEWNPSAPRGSRLRTLTTQLPSDTRYGASAAWNRHENAVYLFDGVVNPPRIMNFVPDTQQLTVLPTSLPHYVVLPGVFYDASRRTFFIFGGRDSTIAAVDSVWEYNPGLGTIAEVGALSTRRADFSFTYDPVRNVATLFGGTVNTVSEPSKTIIQYSPERQQTPGANRVLRAFYGPEGRTDLGFNAPANEHTLSYGSLSQQQSPVYLVGAGNDRLLFTQDDRRIKLVPQTNVPPQHYPQHITQISGAADLFLLAVYQGANPDIIGRAAGSDGILGTFDDPPSFNLFTIVEPRRTWPADGVEAASDASRSVVILNDWNSLQTKFIDLGPDRVFDPSDYVLDIPFQSPSGYETRLYLEVAVDPISNNCFFSYMSSFPIFIHGIEQLTACRSGPRLGTSFATSWFSSFPIVDRSSLSENGQYLLGINPEPVWFRPHGFTVHELGQNRVIDSTDRQFVYTAPSGNEVITAVVEDEGASATIVYLEVPSGLSSVSLKRHMTGPDRMFGTADDPPVTSVEVDAERDDAVLMYYRNVAVFLGRDGRFRAYHYT